MTHAELMEEVRRLRRGDGEQVLRRTILELQVFREEVRQQNEELIGAQKRLEWTASRYADLFDSAPVGYVSFDGDGVVEEINLTGARMLQLEPARLTGQPFLFHVVETERFVSHVARCRLRGKDVVTELTLRTGRGGTLPVELRSRWTTGPGRIVYRTTVTDLSERRKAEAERQELLVRERVARESNDAKDRLFAILSHELRNPLAAISAGVSALAGDANLPPALAETVARIRRNVLSEARLIADLLDASRLRHRKLRLERRPVDLHLVLSDAIAGLRAELPSFSVEPELRADRPMVDGDETRLGQVIANLLRNAHGATAKGGEIRVTTWNPAPERVALAVIDTGCGIDPAELPRLFAPFEQSRDAHEGEGLGLGLAISKGLVEAHGGELRARSDGIGRGARFDVELPALPRAAPEPAAPKLGTAPGPALRILLVDDHRDTAEALAMVLSQRGFRVTLAHSIASALERAAEGFDVLISDLGLPDGTGRDLARRLAEQGPLRAIAVSGYGADSDVAASREAGFRAHLVKPVEPGQLLKVIARVSAA
jgi:PAS domain S-box-containing protein